MRREGCRVRERTRRGGVRAAAPTSRLSSSLQLRGRRRALPALALLVGRGTRHVGAQRKASHGEMGCREAQPSIVYALWLWAAAGCVGSTSGGDSFLALVVSWYLTSGRQRSVPGGGRSSWQSDLSTKLHKAPANCCNESDERWNDQRKWQANKCDQCALESR